MSVDLLRICTDCRRGCTSGQMGTDNARRVRTLVDWQLGEMSPHGCASRCETAKMKGHRGAVSWSATEKSLRGTASFFSSSSAIIAIVLLRPAKWSHHQTAQLSRVLSASCTSSPGDALQASQQSPHHPGLSARQRWCSRRAIPRFLQLSQGILPSTPRSLLLLLLLSPASSETVPDEGVHAGPLTGHGALHAASQRSSSPPAGE